MSINERMTQGPSYEHITYSYEEGISNVLKIIAAISIFALISMMVSLIIGIRKKDCIAIFTGNIMVKTIAVSLYQVLLDLDIVFNFVFIVIVFFIATIIIEGFIYKKVLKYKKHSGMTVSLICNIGTIIISPILALLIYIVTNFNFLGYFFLNSKN